MGLYFRKLSCLHPSTLWRSSEEVVATQSDTNAAVMTYKALRFLMSYRKLFGYSYRESVTALQHALSRPTWEEMIESRKNAFIQRLSRCPSHSLVRVFSWGYYTYWTMGIYFSLTAWTNLFICCCLVLDIVLLYELHFIVWINIIYKTLCPSLRPSITKCEFRPKKSSN